jgi:hypothetical protein
VSVFELEALTFTTTKANTGQRVSCTTYDRSPPDNDECSNAILIPSDGTTIVGTTELATFNSNTASCLGQDICYHESEDVWYRVIGIGGPMTASLCNDLDFDLTDYDAQIAIYESACDQPCLVFDDDACGGDSQVSWESTAGVEYFIRVFGYAFFRGRFGLRVFPGAVASLVPIQLQGGIDSANISSVVPSLFPTVVPSRAPTFVPTMSPTVFPSVVPTLSSVPSARPSNMPS